MGFHDERRSQRFIGKIPVLLKQGTGVTRDYSADGVYFVTDQLIFPGEEIELVMVLDHQRMGAVVRLRCGGHVVRVEQGEDTRGVAVAITKQLFELAPELAGASPETALSRVSGQRDSRSS